MHKAAFAAVAATALATIALQAAAQERRPGSDERRSGAARFMNELMLGKVPVGGPFTLRDADGKRRRLAEWRGKLVLLYFGYARCPDVCPTDLALIGQLLRELGSDAAQVQPLFVTLDPRRDKPGVMREYAAAFHPSFVALTGSEAEIRKVATAYKVFYEKVPLPGSKTYTIDHAAFTFLLDREGKYVGIFPPGTPTDRMAVMVRAQLGLQKN